MFSLKRRERQDHIDRSLVRAAELDHVVQLVRIERHLRKGGILDKENFHPVDPEEQEFRTAWDPSVHVPTTFMLIQEDRIAREPFFDLGVVIII